MLYDEITLAIWNYNLFKKLEISHCDLFGNWELEIIAFYQVLIHNDFQKLK